MNGMKVGGAEAAHDGRPGGSHAVVLPRFSRSRSLCLAGRGLARLTAAFDALKLWEAADRAAALRAAAPDIRGVASTGAQKIDAGFFDLFPRLEIVANLGVGYDHIDVAAARARGVVVTNTPGVLVDDVADATMGLLLCAVRQLPQADSFVRRGDWTKGPFPLSASLKGRVLGLLCLGDIGCAIARRAEAFGLKIVYHNRSRRDDVAHAYAGSPVELAQACDILVVAAPGGPLTRHIVGARELEALGLQGVLVNIARGSLVDTAALITALRQVKIQTAALDVFETEPEVPAELRAMPQVVLAPHIGSASVATREAMADLVVGNLASWASGAGALTPAA
jgi:lactate dehydrogenase-like 2-hydroxyacid dehydrogenase